MKYQLVRVTPTSPAELKRRVYRLRYAVYVEDMKYQLVRVTPTSPAELKRRVYRLRYAVYVEELGYPLSTKGHLLADEFDDRSSNLLLAWGGEDVGTIRHTIRSDGLLEAEAQSSAWSAQIAARSARGMVSELTRFMVTKAHRGRGAAPSLLSGVIEEWVVGIEACYFAAKPGRLTRYWSRYYAEVADATLAAYRIRDYSLGTYHLMVFDVLRCRQPFAAKLERQLSTLQEPKPNG
jgi:N-acyl-L-homoserine lactone synthetase